MFGLKQVGKTAYDDLKQHLLPHRQVPTNHTPGLLRHGNSKLTFTLIVDDFVIKHTNIAQLQYLIHTLQQNMKLQSIG